MRSVLVITNFNYGHFLGAALDSALAQSRPFDRILVVDDGSTDHSRALLGERSAREPRLQVLLKANGGQLSCFNAVRDHVQDQDLVCLLDADDLLPPDHLAALLPRAQARQADFWFMRTDTFDSAAGWQGLSGPAAGAVPAADVVLPCSSALTRRCQTWVGSPTSALALTGALYRQLFPAPNESDWRTRADDVIVFGSSVLGARKAWLPSRAVGYRAHGHNAFLGRALMPADDAVRRLRLERLIGHYARQQHIAAVAPADQALREWLLVPARHRRALHLPRQAFKVLWGRHHGGLRAARLMWQLAWGRARPAQ